MLRVAGISARLVGDGNGVEGDEDGVEEGGHDGREDV